MVGVRHPARLCATRSLGRRAAYKAGLEERQQADGPDDRPGHGSGKRKGLGIAMGVAAAGRRDAHSRKSASWSTPIAR